MSQGSGKKYQVIYADPPWAFNNKNTGGSMSSGSASQYPVMTPKSILELPVNDIADENCMLFMWWVASQPDEALAVCRAWGFTLKTMSGFNWVKITKHGKKHFGMGFWTRAGSELCLIATKGKPKPQSRGMRSVFEATVRDHSQKPVIIRDKIVELCGDVPRVELFAREVAVGWDSIGYDIDGKSVEKAIAEMKIV